MSDDKIKQIVEYSSNIITEEMVGSRYEGNDISKLWLLGDKVISLFPDAKIPNLLPRLKKIHEQEGIRWDDRLYRAAIIFRRYWDNEDDYQKAISKVNVWTKLRELYPVCKGILEGSTQTTRKEVDELIDKCENLTYMEVRDVFKKFRRRYDKLLSELGIDEYEFSDLLMEVSESLHTIVEQNDVQKESRIRNLFKESLRNFRLLLSALQKEEVFKNKKWNQEIKKIVKTKIPNGEDDLERDIKDLFSQINKFILNDSAREKIRSGIPVTFIGNMSTYLRAIESDENKKQYQKNKDILQKFIGNLSS